MAKNEKKYDKLKLFHKYRFRILLWIVITVLPLTLILIAYIGPYITYSKVNFNQETPEIVSSFDQIDESEMVRLIFDWTSLTNVEFADDGSVEKSGYYQFTLDYETLNSFNITSVSVLPVLQTDWINCSSIGNSVTLIKGTSRAFVVPFDYELPKRKLLFINVTDPILYLKVTISYMSQGESLTSIEYVEINLKEYNPDSVN